MSTENWGQQPQQPSGQSSAQPPTGQPPAQPPAPGQQPSAPTQPSAAQQPTQQPSAEQAYVAPSQQAYAPPAQPAYPGGYASPASQPSPAPVYPPTGAYPGQPHPAQPGQQLPPGYQAYGPMVGNDAQVQRREGLGALFDFSFRKYATPAAIKIIYILAIAVFALGYVGSIIGAFSLGSVIDGLMSLGRSSGSGGGGASLGLGVVTLLFGWVPAAFGIVVSRMCCELVLSNIRLAEDVESIRQEIKKTN